MNLPNLKRLVIISWDHDVTFAEATKNISPENLRRSEKFLAKHKSTFKDGLPFFDDEVYITLVKTITKEERRALKVIEKMVAKFED